MPPNTTPPLEDPVLRWSLSGTSGGSVRSLSGFRKGVHTIPDRHSAALDAFLAKIAAEDLANEAEAFYQTTRQQFAYRRKDLNLTVSTPAAVLETPAFALEITYGSDPDDPARYERSLRLSRIEADQLTSNATGEVFATAFDTLEMVLRTPIRIEDLIDAVEDDPDSIWKVKYPSSCEWCELATNEIEGFIYVSTNWIRLRLPSPGPPAVLLAAYIRLGEILRDSTAGSTFPIPSSFTRHAA